MPAKKTPKSGGGGAAAAPFTYCVGSPTFRPDEYADDAARRERANELLTRDDLYGATVVSFNLPAADTYVYHAMTAVRLAEVQRVVAMGGVNGLHAWYRDDEGKPLDPPPRADIDAYTQIFSPATQTSSALSSFRANAKKSSVRSRVADHLLARRYVHPALAALLAVPKSKKPASLPPNPYLDFWAWSCRNLEWCGPLPWAQGDRLQSHHVLPIFMHHFGCATPTHEALVVLRTLAAGRAVADIGSGNGYWSHMLRAYGLQVHPVDNMQSEWRVNWVPDTLVSDGVAFLRARDHGKDLVLLLVYPVVGGGVAGGTEGSFTRGLVDAFAGDTFAVVGTQNRNGYTAFRDMTVDEYMRREQPAWKKVVQIPLPSFAGKDEALFVFQRGDRAPKDVAEDEDKA
ncbi:hypothetical protein CH063_02001 [Colletotrichum higginsianum]|uniref:Uncharacterized protein n=2 Tax=Colletotrichum higginsianum TaxID=80884 RepID=H1VF52_COLHI|nr:hypothetical protein CH63R_07640 [Colletotrichum higginsianum IMI 349063]OBR08875.1 hypothetical protein CH63R_07640 [Colletotrichum higginsianum IMI 349063]TIC95606.1 hypothetical protein CH35J_008475 [Colletotrichum higginsianum]CCF38855.1 hypothetical protein CH063_02001 [Colletotrichum higginsianum]